MTVTLTETSFPPVSQWSDLDRLAVIPSRLDARRFWAKVHHDVQEQLAVLDSAVCQSVAGVRVTEGSTDGAQFLLFSYRTYSLPEGGVDPVVAGVTFTQANGGINVAADVSGEQTGDVISSARNRTAPESLNELLAAARESALELGQFAMAIAAALRNPSRQVE